MSQDQDQKTKNGNKPLMTLSDKLLTLLVNEPVKESFGIALKDPAIASCIDRYMYVQLKKTKQAKYFLGKQLNIGWHAWTMCGMLLS